VITIGLDVGTTTISGVVFDSEKNAVLATRTIPNTSQIISDQPWEDLQDAAKIWAICQELLDGYYKEFPSVSYIGLTGQMHGILYIDQNGEPISPLVTWQDARGNLSFQNGESYAKILTRQSGYPMATGFGLTTHFFNLQNEAVPEKAAAICTIADYIGMRLCGLERPVMHASNAHSLGMFDLEKGQFDRDAIEQAGINGKILPAVLDGEKVIGKTAEGIAVCGAIGDNQASFLGATEGKSNMLVNIGTSSQLSVRSKTLVHSMGLDTRPYLHGEYLLVGAGLCGGSAYAVLRGLFAQVLDLYGIQAKTDLYQKMSEAAKTAMEEQNPLHFDTRMRGTRIAPDKRGTITQIGTENFTVGHLALGVMRGICEELYGFYKLVPKNACDDEIIIGSGNALRKNAVLRETLARQFRKYVQLSPFEEEAALGASLIAQNPAIRPD